MTTKENTIEKGKRFAIPFNFEFFKYSAYPYVLKEDLIVRLELNSSEKVICVVEMPQQQTNFQTFL